jgi:hypothetical protein
VSLSKVDSSERETHLMKAGRNELCPCGSGKKSKHCCAGKAAERQKMRGIVMIAAPLLLLAAIGLYAALRDDKQPAQKSVPIPAPANRAAATPGAPPPGPAPAGKVWDVAHGHWHDAEAPVQIQGPGGIQGIQMDGMNVRIDAKTMEGLVGPGSGQAPRAVAPPGKVWSAEHNHWHDAPATALPKDGAAGPDGAIWSAEHNHWHRPDGTAAPIQPPPPGRP